MAIYSIQPFDFGIGPPSLKRYQRASSSPLIVLAGIALLAIANIATFQPRILSKRLDRASLSSIDWTVTGIRVLDGNVAVDGRCWYSTNDHFHSSAINSLTNVGRGSEPMSPLAQQRRMPTNCQSSESREGTPA